MDLLTPFMSEAKKAADVALEDAAKKAIGDRRKNARFF